MPDRWTIIYDVTLERREDDGTQTPITSTSVRTMGLDHLAGQPMTANDLQRFGRAMVQEMRERIATATGAVGLTLTLQQPELPFP